MPKYWGKQIFRLRSFHEGVESKRRRKRRKRRGKVGNNNGQLCIAKATSGGQIPSSLVKICVQIKKHQLPGHPQSGGKKQYMEKICQHSSWQINADIVCTGRCHQHDCTYMCWNPLPQHYKAAARENWDFVYALISRRLKLHSWNFRFRKLRILRAYDLKGSKLHMVWKK